MHKPGLSCVTFCAMKSTRRFPRPVATLALLLFAAFVVSGATAAAKKIPTHEDIWLMKRIGPPQVSPDGRWIVVPVVEPSYDDNNQLSDLWLIDTSARNSSRRLTSTRRPESGVIWSPDSRRIVFSAQRDSDDVPQLYSLDLASGGEAQRLTNLSGGARAPVFAHDGRQLAFVSIMFPGAYDEEANKAKIEAHRTRKSSARIFDGFPIRSWDHWLDERQVRIFVQPLDEDGLPTGSPRDLLAGTQLAANPGFAGRQTDIGEELEIEFTPDNRSLVFAAATNRDKAAFAFTDSQLLVVDVAGGEPRAITRGVNSWSLPQFTPDGRTLLAVVEEQQGEYVYNTARLAAFSWPDPGEPRMVTGGIDLAVNSYAITPNSRTVYFTAEEAGSEKLFSVRLGGGTVQTLFGVGQGLLHQHRDSRPGQQRYPVRHLGKRQRARGNCLDQSTEWQGAGAHALQRRARGAARSAADREFLVHLEPRQAYTQLRRAATWFRSLEEISVVRRHPWRTARHVARPVLHPLELSPAGGAGLRAAAHQLLRIDRLRRGVRAFDTG